MDRAMRLEDTVTRGARPSLDAKLSSTCSRGDNVACAWLHREEPTWIAECGAEQWNVFWSDQACSSVEHYRDLVGMCGGHAMGLSSGYAVNQALKDDIVSLGQTWTANEQCVQQVRMDVIRLQGDNDEIANKITEVLRQLVAEKDEWKARKALMFRLIQERTDALTSYKAGYAARAAEVERAKTSAANKGILTASTAIQRKDVLFTKYQRVSNLSAARSARGSPPAPECGTRLEPVANSDNRVGYLWQLARQTTHPVPSMIGSRLTLAVMRSLSSVGQKIPTDSHGALRTNLPLRTQIQEDTLERDISHFLATHEFDKMMTPRDALYAIDLVNSYMQIPENRREEVFACVRKLLPAIPRLADNTRVSVADSASKNAKALKKYHTVVDEEGSAALDALSAAIADIARSAPPLVPPTCAPVEHYFIALTYQEKVNAMARTFARESEGAPILCGPKHFFAVTQCKDGAPVLDFARAGIIYPSFISLTAALKALHAHRRMCVRHVRSTFGAPAKQGRAYVQVVITIKDDPRHCLFELQLMHRKLYDDNVMDDARMAHQRDEQERYIGPLNLGSRKTAPRCVSPMQRLRISDAMQAWEERANSSVTASLEVPRSATRVRVPSREPLSQPVVQFRVSERPSRLVDDTPVRCSSRVTPLLPSPLSTPSLDKRKNDAEMQQLPAVIEGSGSHTDGSDRDSDACRVVRISKGAAATRTFLTSDSGPARQSADHSNTASALPSTDLGNQPRVAQETHDGGQSAKKQSNNVIRTLSSTSSASMLQLAQETLDGGQSAKKQSNNVIRTLSSTSSASMLQLAQETHDGGQPAKKQSNNEIRTLSSTSSVSMLQLAQETHDGGQSAKKQSNNVIRTLSSTSSASMLQLAQDSRSGGQPAMKQSNNVIRTLSSMGSGSMLQLAQDPRSGGQPAMKQGNVVSRALSSSSINTQLQSVKETLDTGEVATEQREGDEQNVTWKSYSSHSVAGEFTMSDSQETTNTRRHQALDGTEHPCENHDSRTPNNKYSINIIRADHL